MKPILQNTQDPDPSAAENGKDLVKYKEKAKRVATRIVSALFVAFVISVPTAHAGIFSFVADLFGKAEAAIEYTTTTLNSQNMSLLQAALHHDPNPSKGGGDITIVGGSALLPEIGPSGTLADIEEFPASDQISIYVVREDDNLSQIADMFGVSVNTIIWANDIKRGSVIYEGQTLVILPISGVRHTVKKGDTIASIAKKYDGDSKEIMQYNDLTKDVVLALGDIVVIPDGEIATPVYATSYPTSPVRGAGNPAYVGYYTHPVAGGKRSQGIHGYNAVDLASSCGAPIIASADGDVIISRGSGWNGGYGLYVVVKHDNGTQTLYAHNSSNIVYTGQHVVQGQVLGYMGSTGKSTGCHVHFEVRGAQNPF